MKYTSILIAFIILFLIIRPLIKWTAIILLTVLAIFVFLVIKDGKKVKKEIMEDPDKYFSKDREDK